ncbi:MAG: hypothetical protein Q7S37_02575 [bacterium]|nr:hypothetical protein [bacterium]
MKNKTTLFTIFSISLFAFGIWIVILFNVDPTSADKLSYICFVSSLFLWLSGTLVFIEYFAKKKLSNGQLVHLPIIVRHSIMITLALTLLLSLKLLRILNSIDAILIIATVSISELYFKARPNGKPKPTQN